MTDKSWKAWERRVAKWLGGVRRGADVRGFAGGKNDIILDAWSIECKLYKRPSFQMMLDAVKQAEAARDSDNDIACAWIKRKYDLDEDALVIFRKDEFLKWFGNGHTED